MCICGRYRFVGRSAARILAAAAVGCLSVVAACGSATTPDAQQTGRDEHAASVASQPRIVSFSPAITRAIVDLNLEHLLVGRSRYCQPLDRDVPVIGDLFEVDYERLVRVKPTHVLVQPPGSGVDSALKSLCSERGWTLCQWRLNTLDDILTLVQQAPAAILEADSTALDEARSMATHLTGRIGRATSPDQHNTQQLWSGRVLLVQSFDPPLIHGRQTYLMNLLEDWGSTAAINVKGWVETSLEDIVQANPEAVIIVRPGGTQQDARLLRETIGDLPIHAVRDRRVAVLTHPDAIFPSTGIIGVAGELRAILAGFGRGDDR